MTIMMLGSPFLGLLIFALPVSILAFRSSLPQQCKFERASASVSRSRLFVGALKNDPAWTFLDTARIHVKGGDGGRSAGLSTAVLEEESALTSSRKRNKPEQRHKTTNKRRGRGKKRQKQNGKDRIQPASAVTIQKSSTTNLGGKGGNGGSVYLVCNNRLESLVSLDGNVHFEATNGEDGSMGNRDGANGSDIHIHVPSGTMVRDLYSQNLVGKLIEDGDSILLAHGGNGGSKPKRQQQEQKQQQHDSDSSKGDQRWLTVEYQISADVGIVGMANSGKSSILAALSNAKPQIASYPFTTTCPNLGVHQNKSGHNNSSSKNNSNSFTLCDLPGLINGSCEGAGMGGAFLRHVKNCSVLLHVVDASAENPLSDFETVNRELAAFDGKSNSNENSLQDKPQVVVLSKSDMVPTEHKDNLVQKLKQKIDHSRLLSTPVSIVENLDQLTEELYSFV